MPRSLNAIALDLENTRDQLSINLKKLRKTARITTPHLSRKTGIERSKISRIESGIRVPTIEEVGQLLRALKASEEVSRAILALVRTLHSASNSHQVLTYGRGLHMQSALADIERVTSNITYYEPDYIPGLLQTATYARAVIFDSLIELQPEVARDAVRARLQRQEVLFDSTKSFQFIIGIRAFSAPFVTVEEMRAQCNHLCTFRGSKNVHIGIVNDDFVFRSEVINFILYDDVLVTTRTLFGQVQSSEEPDIISSKKIFDSASNEAIWDEEAFDYLHDLLREEAPRLIDLR